MATEIDRLLVRIEANATQFEATLKKMNRGMHGAQRNTRRQLDAIQRDVDRASAGIGRSIGQVGTAFAALGVGIGAAQLVTNFREGEEAAKRLEAVLNTTGHAAGLNQRQIAAWAEELEVRTGRGAAEIQNAAAQLATFTSVGREEFLLAIETANDMAAVFGGDLKSNLDAVARALDDPIEGFANLRKRGFALTEAELARAEAHMKAGQFAAAQQVVLQNLSSQVNGAAEAVNTGLTKALNDLQKQADDTFKQLADQGGTDAAIAALQVATGTVAFLGDNMDTLLDIARSVAVFMGTHWVAGLILSEDGLLRTAMAAAKAEGGIKALTAAMAKNPAVMVALAVAGLSYAIIELNQRFSEGEVVSRQLEAQSGRTSEAFAEYEKAAMAAADATGEAKVQADRLAESKRALYYIEIQQAQALAETTAQMAAQRAEMAKLSLQEATSGKPGRTEGEVIGQLAYAAGTDREATRAQEQATAAADDHLKALQDLFDLQQRIRNGFKGNTTPLEFDGGDKGKKDDAARKSEQRRRAIEDMAAEIDMQEAILRNDLDRVDVLERQAAVRQRTRALIDSDIQTDPAKAAAEAERVQLRLDEARVEQRARLGHEARKALDLELYSLEANHEMVRTLEREAELKERVAFWQEKGFDLITATEMATLDLVELENARTVAAERSLDLARKEHELTVAELSGNERLAKVLQDQAEIRERTERYRTEGRMSPEDAERRATSEVSQERAADTYGRNRDLFATAFSDGIRAAMDGDITGFLANQFEGIADIALQRLGEHMFDMAFGGVSAAAEGAAEGAAIASTATPALIAAGAASGGALVSTVTPALIAAGAAAGQAYAMAAGAAKAITSIIPGVPGLPGRAMGGPVTAGRAYLVGERRPEVFVPKTDGSIIPSVAAAARSLGGAAGRQVVEFRQTINLEGANGDQTIRQIAYQAAAEGSAMALTKVRSDQARAGRLAAYRY